MNGHSLPEGFSMDEFLRTCWPEANDAQIARAIHLFDQAIADLDEGEDFTRKDMVSALRLGADLKDLMEPVE